MNTSSNTVVRPKYATATWYYQNDEAYREKARQWSKESIQRLKAKDPEGFNEKNRVYMKNKYHNDPEYAQKQRDRALARYYAKKAAKSQEVQDPAQMVLAEAI